MNSHFTCRDSDLRLCMCNIFNACVKQEVIFDVHLIWTRRRSGQWGTADICAAQRVEWTAVRREYLECEVADGHRWDDRVSQNGHSDRRSWLLQELHLHSRRVLRGRPRCHSWRWRTHSLLALALIVHSLEYTIKEIHYSICSLGFRGIEIKSLCIHFHSRIKDKNAVQRKIRYAKKGNFPWLTYLHKF